MLAILFGAGCGASEPVTLAEPTPRPEPAAWKQVDLSAYEGARPLRTMTGAALIDPRRGDPTAEGASGKGDGELLATSDVIAPGSVARVVNTETDQSVVVRIDARADDAQEPAQIRLSPEAALRIGMTDTRPMLVRIEVLAEPPR